MYLSFCADEAQNIKNTSSARYKSLFALKTKHRLLLTGTPVEVQPRLRAHPNSIRTHHYNSLSLSFFFSTLLFSSLSLWGGAEHFERADGAAVLPAAPTIRISA
jgi:hypothetical protein